MKRHRKPTGLPAWLRIVRETGETYNTVADAVAPIRSPQEAARIIGAKLEQEEQEVFVVLLLNAQHRLFAMQEVTRGILNSSMVHPREVFRLAIAYGAAAIIVAHNHPSGDPNPSADDRSVTDQIVAAGRLLDIPVHDHIIVVHGGRYTSFAEAGLL